MVFFQLDVFADKPFSGNQLAVVVEPGDLSGEQMQAIASEMNLSETTFVTGVERDSYVVRIFTTQEEMPFAGHPTIGTAWLLRHLGKLSGDLVTQRSPAGVTQVAFEGLLTWLTREVRIDADVGDRDPTSTRAIADLLGVEEGAIGLEARELGRSGLLRPAPATAGLPTLLVPIRDLETLGAIRPPDARWLLERGWEGAYCFTVVQAGRLQARGLMVGVGVSEDPATGSAAAALGGYLSDRVGDIDFEIAQGIEMGRPSRIHVRARGDTVRVGGGCHLVATGRLDELP